MDRQSAWLDGIALCLALLVLAAAAHGRPAASCSSPRLLVPAPERPAPPAQTSALIDDMLHHD